MKDYFIICFKNLKRRGIRSWLTLLGIFIGIAAVVSLISLGNALKDTVNAQFGISDTELISVQAGGLNSYGPPGSGAVDPLQQKDLDAIERLGLVDVAIGRDIRTAKIEFNNIVSFSYLASIPDDDKRDYIYEFQELETTQGRLIKEGDRGVVLLGSNYAEDTNAFGKKIKAGDKIKLQDKEFRVIGILKKQGSFTSDAIAMIQEGELKELLNIDDEIDVIAVKPKNRDDMEQLKEDIEKTLRRSRNVKLGEENFEVSTPEATLATINQILTGIQIFIVIIASISIFVGAIGIANTMVTSVMERTKEIGVMKAIGARNEDIFWLFFIEAGLLGLIGGLIGILGGLAIGYLGVYSLNSFLGTTTKLNLDFLFLGVVLSGSFLIGSLSGIIPSMKAARLNPVEALRG